MAVDKLRPNIHAFRHVGVPLVLVGICCSVVLGQSQANVAVLLSSPVTSDGQDEAIRVYKNANQTVTFSKAAFEDGPSNDQDYLVFSGDIPDDSVLDDHNDSYTTLALPGTMNILDVSGIYTVSVSDRNAAGAETQEMRVIILRNTATHRSVSTHFTVESAQDVSVSTFDITTSHSTTNLRWRIDGAFCRFFDREPCTRFKTESRSSAVFEAFSSGSYLTFNHARMNVLVRGCSFTAWGDGCTETCPRCFNGGSCSVKTGLCMCPPGFSGQHCEEVHGRNVFGQQGQYRCDDSADTHASSCEGSQICYPGSFGCVCAAGYAGLHCSQECDNNKFGSNCRQDCHCIDGVECERDTGVCGSNSSCAIGWKGVNCQVEDPCPVGTYGDLCAQPCSCIGDECTEVEENCSEGCAVPWTEASCNEEARLEPIQYVRVNPGAETTITCTAIVNPLPREEDLRLRVDGRLVTNPISSSDPRGYNRTSTWNITLNDDSRAECSVDGTDLMRNITLLPYDTPSFADPDVLQFGDISATSINVSWPAWQDSIDVGDGPVVGYIIIHFKEGATADQYQVTDILNETFHRFGNLTPDTNYVFLLVAIREGEHGRGPSSLTQNQRTLCQASAPAVLSQTTTNDPINYAYFPVKIPEESEWNCREINVSLQRQKLGEPWQHKQDLGVGYFYAVAGDFVPCTFYNFRIKISSSGGNVYSNTVNITTASRALPRVQNLSAEAGLEAGSILVSWDPPDTSENNCPLYYYHVRADFQQFEPSCTGPYQDIVIDNATAGHYTFRGLRPSARYYLSVQVQGIGRGAIHGVYGSTDRAAPSAPPGNVQALYVSSRYIQFRWDMLPCQHRNGPIESYRYNFSGDATVGSTERLFETFTDLVPFTEYSFQVAARTDAGLGPCSETITVVTDEDEPPPMDAPVSPFANLSTILLRWDAPSPPHGIITEYRIRYRVDGGPLRYKYLRDRYVSNREFLLTDLKPNSNYTIWIRAYTSVGGGDWSLPLRELTAEGIPGPPGNLQVTDKTMTEIILLWSSPLKPQGQIIRYEVSYQAVFRPYAPTSTEDEEITRIQIPDVGAENITHRLTELEPSTVYEISVSAATSAGLGDPVTINSTTEAFTDLQAPDVSKIVPKREGNTVGITLPPLTQKYATGYRIRMQTVQAKRRRRDLSEVESYEDNPDDYITAELPKSGEPENFVVGDNQTYGEYWNPPLQEGVDYDMSVIAVSQIGDEISFMESEPIKIESAQAGDPEKNGGKGPKGNGDKPSGGGAWYVSLIVLFLLAIIICIGFVFYKRREHAKEKSALAMNYTDSRKGGPVNQEVDGADLEMTPQLSASLDNLANSGAISPKHGPVNKRSLKKLQKGIKIPDLALYVKKKRMSDHENFAEEYEMLPDGQLHSWDVAAKPENKIKNRYGNIIPYDNSRVVLATVDGDPHSDYMNASYIDGYKAPNKYIACHGMYVYDETNASKMLELHCDLSATTGANKASVIDFWRMVWQENSRKIVMLTNVQEGGKRKCEQYWPDESMKYGNLIVTLQDTMEYSTCTMRTFTLSNADDSVQGPRTIHQFHFTAWPDMKVPDFAGPILDFLQLVREEESYNTGPLVVHCSAGVGRTGTFLTLDAMLDMAAAENKINVFQFVCDMRQRRIRMVQVVEQYQFIFDALVEYFVIGTTSIPVEDFRLEVNRLKTKDHSPGVSLLQQQYNLLDLVLITPPPQKFTAANRPENASKNRFQHILPVDTYRPYLMTDVGDQGNNYINATFLNGFQRKNMFLATQMPLESTILDFWRMVWDYNSPVIVMLNELNIQIMSPYWPDSEPVTFGPFTISALSLDVQGGLAYRQLQITNSVQTFGGPRTVTHVQCLDWPQDTVVASSPNTLLQAVNMMNESMGTSDGPITVHCIDGVGRTGVFCAVVSALDQIRAEKKADVFQLVNKMRTSQPLMLNNFELYKFIFDCIVLHLEDDNIYENFSQPV